jgi:hypothetical protein
MELSLWHASETLLCTWKPLGSTFARILNLAGNSRQQPVFDHKFDHSHEKFFRVPQQMTAQANPYNPDFRLWFFRENSFSIITVSVCLSYTL